MREHRRIPRISPSIKRLIATEALSYPDMPRDYLAQSLKEKIEAVGEIPPTAETLKRKISDARQNPPNFSHYWYMGLQLENGLGRLPVEAIPRIIEIQRTLNRKAQESGFSENLKIPVYVAFWIGQLYKIIDDPETLYVVSYAYALYVIVGQVAEKDLITVDTSELDNMLVNEDYEALAGIAVGFETLLKDSNVYDISKKFPEIRARIKKITKENPKEGKK